MYKDLMDKLMMQQDLTRDDLFQMISDVVTETMTAVQIMGFQMAFLMKEPTPEELAWYVEAMQAHSHKITVDCGGPSLDIAGTGDGEQPGKLYAGAAILAAAGGVPVVKQIRRAQKGYYGSEEVLSLMGIHTDLTPEQAARLVQQCGIAFVPAKKYHPALERTLNEQTEAQIRCLLQTVIGPLMNPAYATRFVLGVHDEETLELLRGTVENLPQVQALLLRSETGADQITLSDITYGYHWDGESWSELEITAELLGLRACPPALLDASTPQEAAHLITGILDGAITDPRRDVLLANAGAALWLGGKAADLQQGVQLAADLIRSGSASKYLASLRTASMAFR